MSGIMQDYHGRIDPLWIHVSESELLVGVFAVAAVSFILGLSIGVLIMAAL